MLCSDTKEPVRTKSSTSEGEPIQVMPYVGTVEPNRAKLWSNELESVCTKSSKGVDKPKQLKP